jgi:hypothetical protein
VVERTEDAYADYLKTQFIIRPAYRYTTTLGDRLSLGLKGGFDIAIGSGNEKPDNGRVITDIYNYPNPADNYTRIETQNWSGTQRETSSFEIVPEGSAGIQFAAIPNRLTLNVGVWLGLPGFSTEFTKETLTQEKGTYRIERADGSVEEFVGWTNFGNPNTNSTETVNTWSEFKWSFGAGFSFLFNENFGVDLACTSNSFTNLDLTNFAVLFTVKK